MLPKSVCFVDLETTGTNAYYGKIIEIGILKVKNGKVVKKYQTLVNPQTYLDPFIENLTGIHANQLENAPTFENVAKEVYAILEGSTFVAHNVRFDYGFIKSEFKRLGLSFKSKHFCTIKLARLLFPNLGHYNLDSIMQNFEIKCQNRHRAFDDAQVLWKFVKKAQKKVTPQEFAKAIDIALKKPTVPTNLSQKDLDALPESPGVYIFYGDTNQPLYIGKSVNIRERVLSHFSNDYLSTTDMQISRQVKYIETKKTAGELGALLLESTLVKSMQPLLNRQLRHAYQMIILLKTTDKNGYNSVKKYTLEEIEKNDIENILGVFRSQKQLTDFLFQLAGEFKLCAKLLGIEKTKSRCFGSQLQKCNGACAQEEIFLKYNLRFDEAFFKKKVKPWKFDAPIVIKEVGEEEEHFVVDKWCFLGRMKNQEDIKNLKTDYTFDFDTYKILKRYISNPNNLRKISTFKN